MIRRALADIGHALAVELAEFPRPRFGADRLAEGERAGDMLVQCLGVVVDDEDRNPGRLDRGGDFGGGRGCGQGRCEERSGGKDSATRDDNGGLRVGQTRIGNGDQCLCAGSRAPMDPTANSTVTSPAFSNCSVPLTLSPSLSGRFRSMNMMW